MTLGELYAKLTILRGDGVTGDTPVSIDLNALMDRKKNPDWDVLEVENLEVEEIFLCDQEGKPLNDADGKQRSELNLILK